jgi:hypothetical protein
VVVVVNREGVVMGYAGADFMPTHPKVGVDRMPEQSAVYPCMEKKETINYIMPKSILGVKIIGNATPIFGDSRDMGGGLRRKYVRWL